MGLTDSDYFDSFSIEKIKGRFVLKYSIHQPFYNLRLLYHIKKTLGYGKVLKFESRRLACFTISDRKVLKEIIFPIFDKYPLLTSKYFNYFKFKQAFYILENASLTKDEKDQKLFVLKDQSIPENYISPAWNNINLPLKTINDVTNVMTKPWLVGFIEADGSFFVRSTGALGVSIKQKGNLGLMKAIQNFFNKLLTLQTSTALKLNGSYTLNSNINIAPISTTKTANAEDAVNSLTISREGFIINVLIPFFDSLIWHTKKEIDYKDWKTILNIKSLGLDSTEKGKELIKLIVRQMNNNRLSTAGLELVNRTLLQSEIEKLISGEMKAPALSSLFTGGSGDSVEEKITTESSNRRVWSNKAVMVHLVEVVGTQAEGNILNSFNSLADCAKHLGISTSTLQYRLRKGKPFMLENKLVNIVKI